MYVYVYLYIEERDLKTFVARGKLEQLPYN